MEDEKKNKVGRRVGNSPPKKFGQILEGYLL